MASKRRKNDAIRGTARWSKSQLVVLTPSPVLPRLVVDLDTGRRVGWVGHDDATAGAWAPLLATLTGPQREDRGVVAVAVEQRPLRHRVALLREGHVGTFHDATTTPSAVSVRCIPP